MKKYFLIIILLCFCFVFVSMKSILTISKINNNQTEWIIAELLKDKKNNAEVVGKPKIIASPYGDAVSFNGIDQALFLNKLPLKSIPEFTVEMIFKPEQDAPFEQRVLHVGESKKDRMLLEIRAVKNNWYFDGYACSGTNKKALIDENKLHPLGHWYHVAFVVSPTTLTTFVNGKQELKEDFSFLPIESGSTSIGVRMNKVSWFKGAIYKIRITPKSLKTSEFIDFK